MPRDTRLTLWPEQTAYYPLSNSWAEIKNTETIDLSHCCGVHSCGLAATVLNLEYLFNYLSVNNDSIKNQHTIQLDLYPEQNKENNRKKKNRQISTIVQHDDREIMEICAALGFFNCIKMRLTDELRDQYFSYVNIETKPIWSNYFSTSALSYPIYHFNFEQYHARRDYENDLLNYIEPIFDDFFVNNRDRGYQLNHVLDEIVKNIADHANADGFMGIDIIYSQAKKTISILVGDIGPGIYQHISKFVVKSRKAKLSFAEAYYWALKNEVSGSSNPENYGCGMSSIVNNCIAISARISVFDQSSRLILSALSPIDQDAPSHNSIWRSNFRFDGKKPFFYFIECEEPHDGTSF